MSSSGVNAELRINAEIDIIAGADVVHITEGRVTTPQRPGFVVPPGSENRARSRRSPRNLGGPSIFSAMTRREVPGDQLQARGRRIRRPRERNTDATGIPPSEGDEARRDGWWGVGASN